jgi:hypothetical protein
MQPGEALDRGDLRVRERLLEGRAINPLTGCWEWQGRRDRWGYGRITIAHRRDSVHRRQQRSSSASTSTARSTSSTTATTPPVSVHSISVLEPTERTCWPESDETTLRRRESSASSKPEHAHIACRIGALPLTKYPPRPVCQFGGTVRSRGSLWCVMGDSHSTWVHSFPYRGGDALVARLRQGWRVEIAGHTAIAKTLVEAFEDALQRNARQDEVQVVVAAMAWDRHLH